MKIGQYILIIICLGATSCSKPVADQPLEISTNQLLDMLHHADSHISLGEAEAMIYEYPDQYRFIDIRDKFEFEKGHLKTALNIPANELLEKAALDKFMDDSNINILYGGKNCSVEGIHMLLLSMGFDNVYMLDGVYSSELGIKANENSASIEDPRYDYAAVFAALKDKTKKEFLPPPPPPKPKKIALKKKPVKKVVEEEEEEEEEGC